MTGGRRSVTPARPRVRKDGTTAELASYILISSRMARDVLVTHSRERSVWYESIDAGKHQRQSGSGRERWRPHLAASAPPAAGLLTFATAQGAAGASLHLALEHGRRHTAPPGPGHGPAAALMAARWFAVLRPRLAALRPRSAAMAHRPPPVSRLLSSGGSSPSPTDVLAAELARLADLPRAQFLAGLAQTTDVVTGGMPQVFLLAAAASSHLSVPR